MDNAQAERLIRAIEELTITVKNRWIPLSPAQTCWEKGNDTGCGDAALATRENGVGGLEYLLETGEVVQASDDCYLLGA